MLASVRLTAWRRLAAAGTPASRGIRTGAVLTKDADDTPSLEPASEQKDEVSEILGGESIPASVRVEKDESQGAGGGRRGRSKVARKERGQREFNGFRAWLSQEGQSKYEKVMPGKTNYVGGEIPFPMNPFFKPRKPVSDAKKEQIYAKYLENPLMFTPRVLGEKFSVSIKRVEAILKLKAIEKHMVKHNDFKPQKKLTAGMESIMGVDPKGSSLYEGLITERPRISNPRFHAVPEGKPFTASDAADVLGRKPYQQIVDRLAASKPFTIDYPGLDEEFAPRPQMKLSDSEKRRLDHIGSPADVVLEEPNDALASRRWKYVFTDVSKHKSMKDRFVLVRGQDGSLKNANRDYKLKRYGQLWYN
ncbi:hypothetical protein GGF46_004006 [Coemansia sp. RSA 552]|nr:hypothetical protein GGF46_004006 [Coemansia sp. RSA 552]